VRIRACASEAAAALARAGGAHRHCGGRGGRGAIGVPGHLPAPCPHGHPPSAALAGHSCHQVGGELRSR